MAKFRDMPEWEEVKKDLAKKLGFDEATIARIGGVEGDCLDSFPIGRVSESLSRNG